MSKINELIKKRDELNAELDKTVQQIYSEMYNVKEGDLFISEENEYFRILEYKDYKVCKVLIYSFNRVPYVDVAEYVPYQLPISKVETDNGTLEKIIAILGIYV